VQEGVIEPVGSNRRIPVDVRVVSSTHRNLEAAIAAGAFREDLFYRLNVLRIHLPPLRDRRRDVAALAESFLARFGREMAKGPIRLSEGALRVLESYPWPGNVRELRNLMERAVVLAPGDVVDEALAGSLLPAAGGEPELGGDLASAVAATERKAILRALAETGDDKAAAARRLGIGERTLWTKLKKHGL